MYFFKENNPKNKAVSHFLQLAISVDMFILCLYSVEKTSRDFFFLSVFSLVVVNSTQTWSGRINVIFPSKFSFMYSICNKTCHALGSLIVGDKKIESLPLREKDTYTSVCVFGLKMICEERGNMFGVQEEMRLFLPWSAGGAWALEEEERVHVSTRGRFKPGHW